MHFQPASPLLLAQCPHISSHFKLHSLSHSCLCTHSFTQPPSPFSAFILGSHETGLSQSWMLLTPWQAGVPRTAYKGVVYFRESGRLVFIAPSDYREAFNLR